MLPIVTFAISNNFVLGDKSVILDKTVVKINQIGKELKDKTNVSIYISISKKALHPKIKDHLQEISKGIDSFVSNSTIIIGLALDIKKIAILSNLSDSDKDTFDNDDILNNYIIPFLVGRDKNSINSKYSAGLLNGYSQIAEVIAKKRGIVLDNAIYSGSKDFFDIFRTSIYAIFIFIVLLFIFIKIKYRIKK